MRWAEARLSASIINSKDLGEPCFWKDKSATPADDSPRITFKNLEVLAQHMRQPELLYKGQPRRVILSEQGFHCPERADGERDQAAAYCAAYWKVAHLDGIDAFILHRHVDHAHEGLNLGLWTHQPDAVSTMRREFCNLGARRWRCVAGMA